MARKTRPTQYRRRGGICPHCGAPLSVTDAVCPCIWERAGKPTTEPTAASQHPGKRLHQ